MNTVVWCVVGLLAGGAVVLARPGRGLTFGIESVLVAVFGAFIGGDFVASFVGAAGEANALRPASVGLSVAGAVVLLLLLAVMRRAVGPLRPHKRPRR